MPAKTAALRIALEHSEFPELQFSQFFSFPDTPMDAIQKSGWFHSDDAQMVIWRQHPLTHVSDSVRVRFGNSSDMVFGNRLIVFGF
jgi:hypothetical protein